jgi:hypothetical protein
VVTQQRQYRRTPSPRTALIFAALAVGPNQIGIQRQQTSRQLHFVQMPAPSRSNLSLLPQLQGGLQKQAGASQQRLTSALVLDSVTVGAGARKLPSDLLQAGDFRLGATYFPLPDAADFDVGFAFRRTPVTSRQFHGVYPAGTDTLVDAALSFDEATDTAGSGQVVGVDQGGIRPSCEENQTGLQLQAGKHVWSQQVRSPVPAQFPLNVLTVNGLGNTDPLDLGPVGSQSNILLQRSAGSWCVPSPMPVDQSDPFERRRLLLPAGILIAIVFLFWLTRGLRMPT